MDPRPLVLLILGLALKGCWCGPTSTPQITNTASVTIQNASYIPGIFTSGLLIIPFTPAQQVYINSGVISNTSVLTGYTLPTVTSTASSTDPAHNITLASLTNPLNVMTNIPVTDISEAVNNIKETKTKVSPVVIKTNETIPITEDTSSKEALNKKDLSKATNGATLAVDDKNIDITADTNEKITGDITSDELTSGTQEILDGEITPASNKKITGGKTADSVTTNNRVKNTPEIHSMPTTDSKTETVIEVTSTDDATLRVPEGLASHMLIKNSAVMDGKTSDGTVQATAEKMSPTDDSPHHTAEDEPMLVDDKSADELIINMPEVNGNFMHSQNSGENTGNAVGSTTLFSGEESRPMLQGTQGHIKINPGQNYKPQPMYLASGTPGIKPFASHVEESAIEMNKKPSEAMGSQVVEVAQTNSAWSSSGAAGNSGTQPASTGSNSLGASTYTSNQNNNNWNGSADGNGGSNGYINYSTVGVKPQGIGGSYQSQSEKVNWQGYSNAGMSSSPTYYSQQGHYGLNNGYASGNNISEKPSTSNSGSMNGHYSQSSGTGGSVGQYYSHYSNGATYGSTYSPGYVTTVAHPYTQYTTPSKTSYMVAPVHQVLSYKPSNGYVAIPTKTNVATIPVAKKTQPQ